MMDRLHDPQYATAEFRITALGSDPAVSAAKSMSASRGARLVSRDVMQTVLRSVGEDIGKALRSMSECITAMKEENVALRMRIEELEQRKGVPFKGTWSAAKEYGADDLVQNGGQLWICQRQGTRAQPKADDA
jgi:hypothetical protein